jgi:hypothetical protein
MPTALDADDTLPVLARTLPLAATLLSSWEHEGHLLGEYAAKDADRMDARRVALLGMPSILA